VPPTTSDAVKAADDALKAILRLRNAACGEDNEWLGRIKCKDVQKTETTARTALATAQSNKDATDAAAETTARKEVLEAQLKASPAVMDADPGATVWDSLFGIDPAVGRTWQGIVGVILIEIGIAALLFGFEMLRPKSMAEPKAQEPDQKPVTIVEPLQETVSTSNVVALRPKVGDGNAFMFANVARVRGCKLSWVELCAKYRHWCADEGFEPMSTAAFGEHLDGLRADGVYRMQRRGEDVYFLDVAFI